MGRWGFVLGDAILLRVAGATYSGSFERPSRRYASRQIASPYGPRGPVDARPDPVGGIRSGARGAPRSDPWGDRKRGASRIFFSFFEARFASGALQSLSTVDRARSLVPSFLRLGSPPGRFSHCRRSTVLGRSFLAPCARSPFRQRRAPSAHSPEDPRAPEDPRGRIRLRCPALSEGRPAGDQAPVCTKCPRPKQDGGTGEVRVSAAPPGRSRARPRRCRSGAGGRCGSPAP